MHELSIAQELMALCHQRLLPGQQIVRVAVAVGELASVEPELLRFAWQAVVSGTEHVAAEIDITWYPARQHCSDCGEVAERQPGSWLRLCPRCQQPLHVTGGDQLDLVEVVAAAIPESALSETVSLEPSP